MTAGLREAKREATARELASTAYELVVAHGFASVTVDDIVGRAGVSRRTFSNYYASKEAAVAATLEYAVSDGLRGWQPSSSLTSLVGLTRHVLGHLFSVGAPARLIELAGLARVHPQLLSHVLDAHWRAWLLAGARIRAARANHGPTNAVEVDGVMGALFGAVSGAVFGIGAGANLPGGESESPPPLGAAALVADMGALLDRLEHGFGAD